MALLFLHGQVGLAHHRPEVRRKELLALRQARIPVHLGLERILPCSVLLVPGVLSRARSAIGCVYIFEHELPWVLRVLIVLDEFTHAGVQVAVDFFWSLGF